MRKANRFALFAVAGVLAACGGSAANSADATADASSASDTTADTAPGGDVQPALAVTDPLPYANPKMGSGGYAFAFGSAFVGATSPNGMMRVGPETSGYYASVGFLHFSGYWGGDDTIRAFSHLHLHGTGATDYGTLGIMPTGFFDSGKWHAEDYAATFKKEAEDASPGYYGVKLDNGILAEFTATTHAALERFTFPADAKNGTLVIDLSHTLSKVEDSSLTLDPATQSASGWVKTSGGMSGGYTLYFALRAAKPWTNAQLLVAGLANDSTAMTATGKDVVVALLFAGNAVNVQVGVSLVSRAGAEANLAAEISSFDFDQVRKQVEETWTTRLTSLTVYGGSEAARKLFYSSLHHTFVMPGTYSDVDGSFIYAGKTQKTGGFRFLTDISGWDIYRTLTPLYDLIARDVALDTIQSMYAMAKITGNFPKWSLAGSDAGTMIGAAADVMIADGVVKGITGFDTQDVYKRLRDAALEANLPPGEGRGGRDHFDDYAANGFLHDGNGPAVSLTCELNQDDFALANLATALGMADDATVLAARARGYQKLYDPATGFLRGRDAKGALVNPNFKPDAFDNSEEYDEADAYQTQFCPQFDAAGLAQTWGGKDKLVAALEDLFAQSKAERDADVQAAADDAGSSDGNVLAINLPPKYYFGGNEPDIHYPWLFAQLGRPDLTQKWVTWAMRTYFTSQINGLPGNDDGGTMTAWYVFGALGLYPVPGSDVYLIGSPHFPRVDIRLETGIFSVHANGVSDANLYVQSATLNGKPLTTAVIHHADLQPGGALVLEMGPTASTWGQN